MKSRRADIRTIWVFAVVAVLVLVIVLSGVWKKFEFFTTLVSFLGFEKGVPSGASMIGLNLDKGDLEYFTGEKWVKIKSDADFVLDVYQFNPNEVKNQILQFYRNTPRKPETFSIDVNLWRYWDVGFSQEVGKAKISSLTKNGFAGPTLGESAHLSYTDSLDYEGISSLSSVESHNFYNVLKIESDSQKLEKIIYWRDSIFAGKSCEKFLPLKIIFKNSQLSPPLVNEDSKYLVRKIDEYIFVDLSKPVESGTEEKYGDGCFKIESFKDIDRSNLINTATVQIKFIEDGTNSKIWWIIPQGKSLLAWYYESSKTDWNKQIMNPSKYLRSSEDGKIPLKYHLDKEDDFYAGLAELAVVRSSGNVAALNNKVEAYDVHVYVENKEINLDRVLVKNINAIFDKNTERGLNNDFFVSDNFVYAILDEYNTHLKSPPIPISNYRADMPEYFFVLENDNLILMNNYKVKQNVKIFDSKVILGTRQVGEVSLEGIISIRYGFGLDAVFEGNAPALDFMHGKNIFDFSYSPADVYVYPNGFKKINRADISHKTLRAT